MAFCTNCGRQIVDDAKFCSECGAPVANETEVNKSSLDVDLSIQVVLKGSKKESTDTEVYIPHLNRAIMVRVPNSISVGQALRLHGLGRTSPNGRKGDTYLYIAHIDYAAQQQEDEAPRRKESYEGEIRKCPNCGDIIDPYETVCEACGYEIRARKTTSVVHELSLKLEQTDDAQKKDELIRTFYIPNTKEDIYEFFILALSNIKTGGMDTNAWMVKLEQAYQKAELSFGNSHELERLKSLYANAQSINRTNKTLGFLKSFGRVFSLFGKALKTIIGWAATFMVIGGIFYLSGNETVGYVLFGIGAYVGFFALINAVSKNDK